MPHVYDFTGLVDRTGSQSLKWGIYADTDILPMWVADMDFPPCPAIREAIHQFADRQIYGYAVHPEEITELLIARMQRLFGWETKAEDYIFVNGVVPGLNIIGRALAAPGDGLVSFTPVYYPFLATAENCGLRDITIPLVEQPDGWDVDFAQFGDLPAGAGKILQFCNPHNPVGKVFSKAELEELGRICAEKDIVIASDEIHCDLLLDRHKPHIPLASLSPKLSRRTVTLMAPTKTWSTPGIPWSFMIVQNPELRQKLVQFMKGLYGRMPGIANAVALAAYKHGEPWLAELLDVLRTNCNLVYRELSGIPGFRLCPAPEATYLAWADCRQSRQPDMKPYLEKTAQVGVSDGAPFGGKGFVRMNFALQTAQLEAALRRMKTALLAIA